MPSPGPSSPPSTSTFPRRTGYLLPALGDWFPYVALPLYFWDCLALQFTMCVHFAHVLCILCPCPAFASTIPCLPRVLSLTPVLPPCALVLPMIMPLPSHYLLCHFSFLLLCLAWPPVPALCLALFLVSHVLPSPLPSHICTLPLVCQFLPAGFPTFHLPTLPLFWLYVPCLLRLVACLPFPSTPSITPTLWFAPFWFHLPLTTFLGLGLDFFLPARPTHPWFPFP